MTPPVFRSSLTCIFSETLATVTDAPALTKVSMMVTLSISSLPSATGTKTCFGDIFPADCIVNPVPEANRVEEPPVRYLMNEVLAVRGGVVPVR